MKRVSGWLIVIACFMGLVGGVPAHAMVKQKAPALQPVGRLRMLNDTRVHFVHAPKHYAHTKHVVTHTIKSSQGTAVTFKTKYLLPQPGYHHQAWGNPQSLALTGRYLYVVYCPTAWHNRGRIVRYDVKKIAALKATATELQHTYAKHATAKEKRLRATIKVGPVFTTGHGQSLAYNWHNHHLYMWCDREKKPRVPINQYGYIQQISAHTLKPAYQIRFRLRRGHYAVPGGHVLAFDKAGRAYFWSNPSGYRANIYQGRISRHKVSFRLTHQVLRRGPGTHVQGIAVNPHNNRLYLVADGSIASLPIQKLVGRGHLTAKQVRWTRFASRREFEGLAFTTSGHGYLLTNHDPEILRGNRVSW